MGTLDELFRTQVRGGLLGSFSFDARGGVVERVVRPSPSLVAPG